MNFFNFLDDVTSVTSQGDTSTSQNLEEILVPQISWSDVFDKIYHWLMTTGLKLLIAIVVLIITFCLINLITKKIYKHLQKKHVDETIVKVAYGVTKVALKLVVLALLIGYVGIETASISAIIASLGVGISLAVQGTLSNFAGGVIIIVMRPFRIGDFITTNDYSGTVEDIHLFYTNIVTYDNKVVMIPNGTLSNNIIVNLSAKDNRRVDIVMPISYRTNVEKAKKAVLDVVKKYDLVLKEPAPFIEVGEYGESSVNLFVRTWTKTENYWTVYYYLLREIRKEFNKKGIEIPFNQLDVHIDKEKK
ncbi:MAG: mechanosensitive ion channel family protein [Bacilli bacterium]